MTNAERATPPISQLGWVPIAGTAIISFVLSGVMAAFMVAVNMGFGADYPSVCAR